MIRIRKPEDGFQRAMVLGLIKTGIRSRTYTIRLRDLISEDDDLFMAYRVRLWVTTVKEERRGSARL